MKVEQCTILLTDDDPVNAELLQRAFRNAGLRNPTYVLPTGEATIAYLKGEGEYAERDRYPLPVLILLDLKLPDCSGFKVLSWVRQQPRLNRMVMVILTGSQNREDIDRAYDMGANSYLVKSPDFQELVKVMKSFTSYWISLNVPPELTEGCHNLFETTTYRRQLVSADVEARPPAP